MVPPSVVIEHGISWRWRARAKRLDANREASDDRRG
jgi:hypothetical protein